jgi:hypothetical protein
LGLALDEPGENEQLHQANGLDFLISEEVMGYAYGSQVDYETTPYGEGFSIGTGHGGCC